ncbi:MAG: PIG-L family deacetylase [Candidatus Omnitrophica bacterium]|nr:PIG-L family deacetylase [Candidatus Omnitrophota bacterium]
MAKKNFNRILIVAAHPDDEILGCAGTVARFVKEGAEAFTLILGEGKTSRDKKRDVSHKKEEIDLLRKEIKKANSLIGVQDVFIRDLPDNRFDQLDLLDVVKEVEEVKKKIKPDIIFTHHEHDLNIDHLVTFRAVMTATRPMKDETVKELYSYEVMSSTEWRFPLTFSPNTFVDISKFIDSKLKAMAMYESELCEYPHPRSLEGIKLVAQNWGMKTGVKYAEAFQLIRRIL